MQPNTPPQEMQEQQPGAQQQQQPQGPTINIQDIFASIGKKSFELDQAQIQLMQLSGTLQQYDKELKAISEANKWISAENEELKRVIAKLKSDFGVPEAVDASKALDYVNSQKDKPAVVEEVKQPAPVGDDILEHHPA